MATLRQRILWRAVPVGLATAAIGYILLQAYLSAAMALAAGTTIQSNGPSVVGPLIFGLVGFVLTTALECIRGDRSR